RLHRIGNVGQGFGPVTLHTQRECIADFRFVPHGITVMNDISAAQLLAEGLRTCVRKANLMIADKLVSISYTSAPITDINLSIQYTPVSIIITHASITSTTLSISNDNVSIETTIVSIMDTYLSKTLVQTRTESSQ